MENNKNIYKKCIVCTYIHCDLLNWHRWCWWLFSFSYIREKITCNFSSQFYVHVKAELYVVISEENVLPNKITLCIHHPTQSQVCYAWILYVDIIRECYLSFETIVDYPTSFREACKVRLKAEQYYKWPEWSEGNGYIVGLATGSSAARISGKSAI